MSHVRIRTLDYWYVCELRGACFVTWVSEADHPHAACFPAGLAAQWVSILEEMTGRELVFEALDAPRRQS